MATDDNDPVHRSIARFDEYVARRAAELDPMPEEDRFGPAEGAEEPEPPSIQARVFRWRDPKSIAPRQWLYRSHYMRGMVSATAGIGGAGKSTLLNVELVSMAIGRDLLDGGKPLPCGPMTVWGHNGEDPYEELERRITAVMQHYGVTEEDLGDRLRITSGREFPVTLARQMSSGNSIVVPTETGKQVAAEIKLHGIQAFVIDPFVTVHQVSENDNGMIDDVMTVLRNLAQQCNCAVEVAHHFRKLNGDEPGVDSIRGASSIVGAARSARIVAGMSKDEATKYGIDDENRGFYSWLQNGKANMLPPTHKRRWMKMESVCLDNAQEPFQADHVGVITSWDPPEADTSLTAPEFRAVRRAIKEANPLSQLRADTRATGWIGLLMAQALDLNPSEKTVRTQMQSMIGRLIAGGSLQREDIKDPVKCRSTPVFRWVDKEDSE